MACLLCSAQLKTPTGHKAAADVATPVHPRRINPVWHALATREAPVLQPKLALSGARESAQEAEGIADETMEPPVGPSPESLMQDANGLREQFLRRAHFRVRQLQIACEKQAPPSLLISALPDEVRAFTAWLGVAAGDKSFCTLADRVSGLILKNLATPVPPFLFAPEDDPICNLEDEDNEIVAHYEGSFIRICPRLVDTAKSDRSYRAETIVHEMFHEPSFRMEHPTADVRNTAHCGFRGADEAVANPYCVSRIIAVLGSGSSV